MNTSHSSLNIPDTDNLFLEFIKQTPSSPGGSELPLKVEGNLRRLMYQSGKILLVKIGSVVEKGQ